MTDREKRLIDDKFPLLSDRENAYRRLDMHEPLAYILGEWYFYDEVYRVTPDVLIPRPDTEILVEAAIRKIPRGGIFIDLCTGSGCIAVSVLRHRPDLRAAAVDISASAVAVARENAVLNGVERRVVFITADITSDRFTDTIKNCPILHGHGGFDALLSNPPYIASCVIDTLEREVLAEPRSALDGGSDGLLFYRTIRQLRQTLLLPGGITLLEIGYDQAAAVSELFGGGEIKRDYGGNDRLFII
jgi:release factor glutamine methyltransferase